MRHLVANIITYSIAALLFIGAAAFAWMRSTQLILSDEYAVLARYEPADTATFAWQRPGESGYVRNCSNCHGVAGQGWDQYPPIAAGAAALEPGDGRSHLIDVMLYGLTSPRFGAPMPPMGHMQDVEIAAVLNYIGAEFLDASFEPEVRPAEVAARRGRGLRPADVEAARATTVSARSRR
jgi:mono/diheme cytochrome c family protein